MPAVSKKQQRFFGYLLSNPEERKKKGISKKDAQDFAQNVNEVAPPGWGHTKAEKEKTKPWKPKSKIGGTAAAFKRALDDGRFKGLPGSKTKKEKTADMFKLMWSMKKKGDKPHYKPGTDKKYEKYQEESAVLDANTKIKKTEERKKKEKELRRLLNHAIAMKQGRAESFEINPAAHKAAQKKTKMRNLARGNENPNEKAAAEKKAGGPKLVGEAVKGQDTESRKEGAKERATEKRAHASWKPGTKKKPLYSTTRHTKGDAESYATQQKQSIKWHDKRTKGKFIPGTTTEDWKPEIEHVKGSDLRKKAAEKKRKEAESSLPPHLKLDVMKKAFKHTNEETSMPNVSRKDKGAIKKRFQGLFKKDVKGTVQGVNEGNLHNKMDTFKSKAVKRRDEKSFGTIASATKRYELLKKLIGSKKKHDKPAIKK